MKPEKRITAEQLAAEMHAEYLRHEVALFPKTAVTTFDKLQPRYRNRYLAVAKHVLALLFPEERADA